jgi:protein-disulfide isomerase
MRQILIINTTLMLTALVAVSACHRDDVSSAGSSAEGKGLAARVAKLEARLDAVEKRRPAGGVQAKGPRLDPGSVYAVAVAGDDTSHGPADAKVTIVEAYEFACPYCAQLAPIMSGVAQKHPSDLRIVSKQFVVHPQIATLPALALCAATAQGKGPAFIDALWKKAWPAAAGAQPHLDQAALARPGLEALAKELGLDAGRFGADLDGSTCKAKVEGNRHQLAALGVSGTPTIFINGVRYRGDSDRASLESALSEALGR